MSAVDTVESEVRELVRRRGLDPVSDRAAVRRLVDEVVTDDDERALTSSLPPLPDPLLAARAVYDAVAGFGPLQRHLDDTTVEEIWVCDRLAGGCTDADGRPSSSLSNHDQARLGPLLRRQNQHLQSRDRDLGRGAGGRQSAAPLRAEAGGELRPMLVGPTRRLPGGC